MALVLTGTVVTGDGKTVYEPGHVVLEHGRVAAVGEGPGPAGERIDYAGWVITPGLINLHAHGVTLGPAHATGSASLSEEEVLAFCERNLAGGTTTVATADGLPLWSEYLRLRDRHPLKVIKGTTHTPANLRAAEKADGAGLGPEHHRATVAELLRAGACFIGEVGAGGTLGGGMQDNVYIPQAIQRRSGVSIEPLHARALKEAVLGRTIDPANLNREALRRAMAEAGLAGVIDEDAVIEEIYACVLPSMEDAYQGLREAAAEAERQGVPVLVHHAAASAQVVEEIASERLIAGHANHPSFTVDEAVASARRLRQKGAMLELSGLNLFTRARRPADADNFIALVRAGLVDFVGTDYAAGDHDPVSVPLAAMIQRGLLDLPGAVALATGNIARRLPELTDAGLLEPGRPADVAVFSPDLASVRAVYIDGRRVIPRESAAQEAAP